MKQKIDWNGVGEWIAFDGQIYVLWLGIIVFVIAMVGVLFFGWDFDED